MAEWIFKLIGVGLVGWFLWALVQPRYVFLVKIRNGRPRIIKGSMTSAFAEQITNVCQEFEISQGWISGSSHGKLITLHFSRSFPPVPRQRLRNEWQVTR
ncbi:hypothetical protein BH10PLA2_BH10PLA2_33080 [soil metagenome]